MNLYVSTFETPVGGMLAAVDAEGALVRLDFADARRAAELEHELAAAGACIAHDARRCRHVVEQVTEYFLGARRSFDLRLAPRGSAFQQRVWTELRRIPYGETCSYGDIAARLGRRGSARAVGRANGSNPIAIVVPCHRVIGADGTLTGYGGGLEIKRRLLELESSRSTGGAATVSG